MSKEWMRRVLACVVCGVMTVGMSAVPAYRGWQTKTLPDGSQITVRQMGDEFFHYWETEDGVQYKHDAIKGWHKVEPTAMTEKQQAKRASRAYNVSKPRRAAGTLNLAPRGLVILVNFSDVSFHSKNTPSAMNDLMNAANYNYDGATGSAREYYRAQSNGKYVPDFDVVGPYTLANNRAHYGANDDSGDDVLAGDMVVEACKAADADGVDFTQYNNDGDTYVDFVYIIYAGAGEADSNVEEAIWPHNWDLASARYYNNCSYSASECKVDGLSINNYACSGELNYGEAGSRCGIGTIAHEFGHVLGLPDYYVTSKSAANYNKKYTPGAWTIMDYGSYNNDGKTPPNYSAFDKYYFGWDTPELLAKDAALNVTLTTAYSDSYQITGGTSLLAARAEQRVWYIENRQKTGWDAYLPGHGMIVWEVTYNSSNWTNNVPNNNTVGYTIVTANNTSRPYSPYVFNTTLTSTSSTPFPGTSNVKSYTPATGCAMTEITESGGVITFKYNGGQTKTECTYEFDVEHCTAPADGVIAINSTLSVTITPDEGYTLADASCWIVEMGSTELTYGSGFTYNESTNEFRIEHVTDDVVILAIAKETFQITWKANGSTIATTTSAGSVVLPSTTPDIDCEGREFYGWCAIENYSSETEAPTIIKEGDAVNKGYTFYAVFAKKGTGGSSSWTLVADASSLKVGDKLVIANKANEVTAGTLSSQILGVVTSTFDGDDISTLGSGTSEFTLGGTSGAWTLSTSNGLLGATDAKKLAWGNGTTTWSISISSGDATIQNGTSSYGKILYNVNNPRFTTYTSSPSASMLLPQIYRKSGGSSYSDFTTTCSAPCEGELTGITLNTENVKKVFTEGEAFTYDGLVVTANYDGCESKTVTPTSVSTPDLSTAGDKTVTVSYTENEITRQNTYSITVKEPNQYTIAFYDNGVQIGDGQVVIEGKQPEVPSDPEPACSPYTFVGWWTDELAKDNTESKAWITDFTATQDQNYYAIYKKTEGSESGPTASVSFKDADQESNIDASLTAGKIREDIVETETGIDSYSGSKVFASPNGAKLGSSKANGQLDIVLSSAVTTNTITINAKQYGTDTGSLSVTVNENTAFGSAQKPSVDGGNLTFTSSSEVEISSVTIATSSKRAYVKSVTIGTGSTSTTYYSSTVSCGGGTSVENTSAEQEVAVKALMNGQIVIIRGDAIYNITGVRIQ